MLNIFMKYFIYLFKIVFLVLLLINPVSATITEDLQKLSKMYNEGLLTKKEFSKAKSILLEIEKIKTSEPSKDKKIKEKIDKKVVKKINKKNTPSSNLKIERIFTTEGSKFTNKAFEKMKLTIGDFLIYTHRPGAIKIKRISDNKQYAVIGDKLKVKFYNKGQDFLDIKVDEEQKELTLNINNSKILVWKGQYVEIAEATFYQILAMGRLPFHFYIKLDTADTAVAINMAKFNRRIELAVDEKKIQLSKKYNISVNQIDKIIEENDMLAAYGESVPTNVSYDKIGQKKLELYADLKKSLGDENYKLLQSNIDSDLNDELNKAVTMEVRGAIDDSIRDAINSGIEQAALDAGLRALIDALMSGASWADALTAGQNACGC